LVSERANASLERLRLRAIHLARLQSAEEIFDDAEIAFMQDDFDTARSKYIQALKLEPEVSVANFESSGGARGGLASHQFPYRA